MTSSVRDWTAVLDSHNVLDIKMEIENGRVMEFSLNYRAQIEGDWVEVVRYDTAHDHLHIHENWKDDPISPLEDEEKPDPPYNQAFTEAEADLKANWKTYRRKMEQKVHNDE